MNGINIYSIITTVLVIVFGYLVSYAKTKTALISKAGEFINKAEDEYKSVSKAGNIKFEYVTGVLYESIPTPMKMFITKPMVDEITQKVFDQIADFATKQLDKVVDNV